MLAVIDFRPTASFFLRVTLRVGNKEGRPTHHTARNLTQNGTHHHANMDTHTRQPHRPIDDTHTRQTLGRHVAFAALARPARKFCASAAPCQTTPSAPAAVADNAVGARGSGRRRHCGDRGRYLGDAITPSALGDLGNDGVVATASDNAISSSGRGRQRRRCQGIWATAESSKGRVGMGLDGPAAKKQKADGEGGEGKETT